MAFVPPARHLTHARDLAALLRTTDRSALDICTSVGLTSLGSFTTSFGRIYGRTPTEYRADHPPAADGALVPACIVRAYGRPSNRTFREDSAPGSRRLAARSTNPNWRTNS